MLSKDFCHDRLHLMTSLLSGRVQDGPVAARMVICWLESGWGLTQECVFLDWAGGPWGPVTDARKRVVVGGES